MCSLKQVQNLHWSANSYLNKYIDKGTSPSCKAGFNIRVWTNPSLVSLDSICSPNSGRRRRSSCWCVFGNVFPILRLISPPFTYSATLYTYYMWLAPLSCILMRDINPKFSPICIEPLHCSCMLLPLCWMLILLHCPEQYHYRSVASRHTIWPMHISVEHKWEKEEE